MGAGASGGADIEGRAFDSGPVGVGLADPQGTAAGLAQAQAAYEAEAAAVADAIDHSGILSGGLKAIGTTKSLAPVSQVLGQVIGRPVNYNAPPSIAKALSPVAYGSKQDQRNALATAVVNGLVDLDDAMNWGAAVNHMNPGLNQNALSWGEADSPFGLDVNHPDSLASSGAVPTGYVEGPLAGMQGIGTNVTFDPTSPYGYQQFEFEEYMDNPTPAFPGVQNLINRTFFSQDNNVEPSIELYDPGTITNPNLDFDFLDPGYQSIFDGVMVDPFDMSRAMVSTEDNPWGYNQSVIDGLNASFDTGAVSEAGGGELQQALAQRVAETMIAQQAARAPSNNVTIPMSSGPDIVIDVTPPAPAPKLTGRQATGSDYIQDANATPAPRRNPVQIAAKSVAKPKAFKALPKFAQKEIRQGKVPTGGSDYVQDMVRAFLAPPSKPIDYSNPANRGGK